MSSRSNRQSAIRNPQSAIRNSDEGLTLLRQLTWRSRLHGVWLRFRLYLTGVYYSAKLLRLAHNNIRVLQHFRRCREVEQLQPERASRFWHLSFYTETFRHCLRLFSPLQAAVPTTEPTRDHPSRRLKKRRNAKKATRQPVAACQRQSPRQTPRLTTTTALSEDLLFPPGPALAALADLAEHAAAQPPRERWKVRLTLYSWLLALWALPSTCVARCRALLRMKGHKAQRRQFYQDAQLTLLQGQQRIAISTQTALFLSLANTIDLKAARELAATGQLVGKHRHQRTMTAEDTACFDHSLNALDGNHETIRVAVQ